MKYVKFKESYRFKDLKNDIEIRKKYSDTFVYSLSCPYIFYCWFAYEKHVVFLKRPQWLDDSTLIKCVIITTYTKSASKIIARNLTLKDLKRVFNKCKSIIL